MNYSVATLTLSSITPYSQSRQHDEPLLPGEDKDAHDVRTWRHKMNTEVRDGREVVVIPAHGLMQAFAAAAKYSKRQIPGQGKATWTAKFLSGVALMQSPSIGLTPDDCTCVTISANSDGVRGSGKRVPRRFPVFNEWTSTFDVHILDPIITEDVFREMVEIAGMFIGIGRFRPEKGGTNGRFKITGLDWQDNRQVVA